MPSPAMIWGTKDANMGNRPLPLEFPAMAPSSPKQRPQFPELPPFVAIRTVRSDRGIWASNMLQ